MRILIYILISVFCSIRILAQSVSISADNSVPDATAMLEIKSNNKGLLVPRMTLAERTSIVAPAEGLMVYQTNDVIGFYYFTGGQWTAFVSTNQITNFGSGKVITEAERTKLTNDADASATNEIQTLTLTGNNLALSNNGGTVVLADNDATNEIQNLTLSGNQLTISSGNNVTYTGWDTNTADDFSADERTKLNGIETGADKTPAGTILPFGGTTIPSGYLWCDGSEVSKSAYPALSAAIGTSWGTGANNDYFKLPDLRGYFLRGVDNMDNTVGTGGGAAGHDPDAASRTELQSGGNEGNNLGSLQEDIFKSHNHPATVSGDGSHSQLFPYAHQGTVGSVSGGSQELFQNNGNVSCGNGAHTHTVTIGFSGQSETRPKNVYVNYIIKY